MTRPNTNISKFSIDQSVADMTYTYLQIIRSLTHLDVYVTRLDLHTALNPRLVHRINPLRCDLITKNYTWKQHFVSVEHMYL